MLSEQRSEDPRIDDILRNIDGLLRTYDPTALMYLDSDGRWVTNPSTPRNRISNELWSAMWQAAGRAGTPRVLRDLLSPFVDKSSDWHLARSVYKRICPEPRGRVDALAVIMELVYWLVEYEACRRVSAAYVAEWDSEAKRRAHWFAERARALLAAAEKTGSAGRLESKVSGLADRLTGVEDSLFDAVCRVIAEEEKLRWHFPELAGGAAGDLSEHQDLEGVRTRPDIRGLTAVPQSLLRPCMELLVHPALNVNTGIQYQVADVLARLADPRSADKLLAALERWHPRYTDLRSKIIYAIGNLRLRKTLPELVTVLEGPASVQVGHGPREYAKPRRAEKREAIWALGKLGCAAVEAVPHLGRYADSNDRDIKTHLAWAMGEIGRGQKEASGGIDARILITLLRLLTSGDNQVVEEAASALRAMGMPDFLNTLYFRDFTTTPMLSLKPSSTGLYELSETILHLVSLKTPVVMAVTGDSGTGKTYFCQAIADGFASLRAREILYLMRDRTHDKTFDRMLGIEWLREHVEPVYYEDYPVPEAKDDPDGFFEQFIRANDDKSLIILDGWRDEAYFHPIITKFYQRGYLDLLVRFQTTYSTRRLNLEDRESSLDGIQVHLPLVENPAVEETDFYREGEVLIYNLDNSVGSRLDKDETLEVFNRQKVDTWGDQIRIGRFHAERENLVLESGDLDLRREDFAAAVEAIKPGRQTALAPAEAFFARTLNDSLEEQPNLLQTITVREMDVNHIAFYTHGQLACSGGDGFLGILTGFNDRIYFAPVHRARVSGVVVVAGKVYSADREGILTSTSFRENTVTVIGRAGSPACSIAAHRDGVVVTGHEDGTVRIWDLRSGEVMIEAGHSGAVCSVGVDRRGRVYSGGAEGELRIWDRRQRQVMVLGSHGAAITSIAPYLDGRVLAGTGACEVNTTVRPARGLLRFVDADSGRTQALDIPAFSKVHTVTVYYDGRLLVGGKSEGGRTIAGTLGVVDPRHDCRSYVVLKGHEQETTDCVSMGPRIITRGVDRGGEATLKIWGTSSYVRTEHDKLRFMPDNIPKPPYYRALF